MDGKYISFSEGGLILTTEKFCIGGALHYPEGQILKVLYRVEADSSYNVARWYRNSVDYIAVLTICGQGLLSLREGQQLLCPGDLFLVPADDMRSYRTEGAEWTFYWFEFDAEHLPLEVQRVYRLSEEAYHLDMCDTCLQQMLLEHWDCASALFTAVVHLWYVACGGADKREESLFLDQALGYMKRHLADMSVQRLAEQMHVNERTLRNLFYRYIGSSPIRVFNRLRMETAADMLAVSHKPVGVSAEELGFSNQFHFSKVFRQTYGCSPRDYRKVLNQRVVDADKEEG